jgi:hypothetical protein
MLFELKTSKLLQTNVYKMSRLQANLHSKNHLKLYRVCCRSSNIYVTEAVQSAYISLEVALRNVRRDCEKARKTYLGNRSQDRGLNPVSPHYSFNSPNRYFLSDLNLLAPEFGI